MKAKKCDIKPVKFINNELFIEAVRPYKILFDNTHRDFKDTGKKENAWNGIQIKFGLGVPTSVSNKTKPWL